jgi:hypothetical protein
MGVIDLSAYKPTAATLGDANQIRNGFTALETLLNGNVDNNNFGAGKIFDPLKLMQDGATAGQALVWSAAANGGTGGWVPGSGGSLATIFDYTVTGSVVATIDSNTILGGNIPQTYKHLKLVMQLRSDWAATTQVGCFLRLNNDSAGHYNYMGTTSLGAAPNVTSGFGNTFVNCGYVPGAGVGNTDFGIAEILLTDYTGTTANVYKQFLSACGFASTAAGSSGWGSILGSWQVAATAITRFQIFPENSTNWIIGSRFTLYGLN